MAMRRPELREVQSVGSLLRQAGQLCRMCVIPICILALVSATYTYTLETYALSPGLAFAHLDGNYTLSQKVNSSLGQSRNSQDLKMSRESFQGGLKEGTEDKGFVARYLAMFLTSFDEALMENLAESKSMYESRAADSRTKSLKRDDSHSDYPSQVTTGEATTTSEASANLDKENGSTENTGDKGAGDLEPIPRFSLKLKVLGKNESSGFEDAHEEKVGLRVPSARLMGGRNVDRGAVPHLGLTLFFMLGVLAGGLMAFCAVIMLQHAALLGTVAYTVINAYVGKQVGVFRAINSGFRLGMIRLIWLAVLHGTIRDLTCLFIMKTFVGGVLEPEKADRLVLRLSFMPFSILAPLKDVEATNFSMAARIGGFVGLDYIFDGAISCVYVMACWVTIMQRQYWGFTALKRGWRLVSSMRRQVIALKLLESILCGRSARWVLQQLMGPFLSQLLVSTAQLYFIICWLVLYLSARWNRATNPRVTHRFLEDFLHKLR